MKLYLLKYLEQSWGEFGGFVIAASSEMRARKLAKKAVLSENPHDHEALRWSDNKITSCVEIGFTTTIEKEGVLLTDFNDG